MNKEKQRQLNEIYRPMNEELSNNLEKQYQEISKVKAESEQIEEMARVYDKARLKARDTLGSMNEGEEMWYSKAFYEAGYRKQSEGEWMQDFDGDYYCPFCAHYPKEINHYCPNCGAKMKGGAE